jgi:hypothetical protein
MATNTKELGLLSQPEAFLRIGGTFSDTPCLYLLVVFLKRYRLICVCCVQLWILFSFLPAEAMMLNLLMS